MAGRRGLGAVMELSDPARQQDPLERFRSKIAVNARAWLAYVQPQRPESADLVREYANLEKAANQALREPAAWADGLLLVIALWPFIEWHGLWLDWRGVLTQALTICRRLGNLVAEVQIIDQLGELARDVGENQAALAWQEEALVLARRLDNPALLGRVLVHLSQQHLPQGRYQVAQACCEEAIALLEPLGSEDEIASAHNNWGIACSREGLVEPALAHFLLAGTMFEAQGNRRGQAKALHNQGELLLRQERWADAQPLYERAIAIAADVGDEVGVARSRTALAILLGQQGHHAAALALLREIERFHRRLGDRPKLARVINNEGAFLFELGRVTEAARALEQAARMHLEIGNLGDAATSLLNWGEILLRQGDPEQALARLQETKELLDALPDPPAQLRQDYAALLEQVMAQRSSG